MCWCHFSQGGVLSDQVEVVFMVDWYLPTFFSVIVPCYNDGLLAIEAVRSCLSQQGFDSLEVLLVDDGSTDGSAEMVAEEFRTDTRVRVLSKQNGGLSSARNYGVENAAGNWLVFLDADDLLSPAFLRHAARAIGRAAGAVDLVVLPFRYVSPNGWRDRRLLLNSLLLAPRFTNWQRWNRFWIRVGNVLPVSSIVVSRSMAAHLGGFDQALKAHEDWEYWIRAIDHGARIRYASTSVCATTLITLREGMSANRSLMVATQGDVRRMYCTRSPGRWLNLRPVLIILLGLRTVLGLVQALAGRRVNLTFP